MKSETIYPGGRKVPRGNCVQIDHCIHTFTVTIESMSGITPDELKDLIQQKFKVRCIRHDKVIKVVQGK